LPHWPRRIRSKPFSVASRKIRVGSIWISSPSLAALTAEADAELLRPLNFRRVEAGGTSFGFDWAKWPALAQAIVVALADYHKKGAR